MDFYCEQIFSEHVPVEQIVETDNVLAFYHTKPSWTFHVVVVPKKHMLNLLDADQSTLNEILEVIKRVIMKNNLAASNYKIVTNGGSFQDSKHLHFHILSGEKID